MKKTYIILIFITLLLGVIGCKNELSDKFTDPSVYTPEDKDVPSGMFAEIMSRSFVFMNDYAQFWYHADAGGMIGHSQMVMRFLKTDYSWFSDANDVEAFYTTSGCDDYFYGFNYSFRELPTMEEAVAAMSDDEKTDNQIYVTLSKMVRDYCASKAVDLYDKVPYTEGLHGTTGTFFPKYDDGKVVYETIIKDLDSYATEIVEEEAKMSTTGKSTFATQDIIFQGDIDKWVQWATALRLRLAVRISGVDEDYAKGVINEIISGGKLPSGDLFIPANKWVSYPKNRWKQGLAERDYAAFIPPKIMYQLDRNKDHKYTTGTDDPRLPVYFLPNRDTLYMPVSLDFSIGQKIFNYVRNQNVSKYNYSGAYYYYNYFSTFDNYMKYNGCSLWNPVTMIQNTDPWRAFTRAEIDFLLAEIQLKGLASTGSSVEQHIKDGVINSINYWYYINSFSTWTYINSSNRSFLMPTAPSESVKETYASVVLADYANASSEEDKMEVIIGQKYLHLCIHDYLEVFTELRRTRHPKLPLLRFSSSLTIAPEVERYPYPSDESSYNSDAVKEVSSENNFTTPIFWVPTSKQSVSYYEDSYNDDYMYTKYKGVPESFPN
jgi:hypothetical protein